MNLFIFGLGYSSCRFLDRFAASFTNIVGTVRSDTARHALRALGCEALLFGPEQTDPAIASHLAKADLLLVSVPPGASADPVLAAFAAPIAESRIRRVIYLSTVGVYGDHGGNWIDETASVVGGQGRRKARIEAEAAWSKVAAGRTTILRLAGIYGPRRNALINLKAGTAHRIVKPGQVFNRIHVDDVATSIAAAVASDKAGTWNICDDEPAPPQDVVAFAAELMGIAPPPEIDFVAADMSEMARSFYQTSNRISSARMKRDLKVQLAYPTYRDGLTALWAAGEGR